jgi:hypothetical protein
LEHEPISFGRSLSKSLLVDVVVEETVVSSVVDAAFAAVDVAARLAVTKKLTPRVVVEIEFLLLRDDGVARIAIEEACLPEEDTPRDAAIARRDANVREEEEEEALPVAVDIFLLILPRSVFVDMLLLLCSVYILGDYSEAPHNNTQDARVAQSVC